jgi:glycyl-tRNA synthetase
VDAFNDPLIDNKDSKKRYRADVLLEDYMAKIQGKIDKEVEKAAKRFGDTFDSEMYKSTNPRVVEYANQILSVEQRLKQSLEENDLLALKTWLFLTIEVSLLI